MLQRNDVQRLSLALPSFRALSPFPPWRRSLLHQWRRCPFRDDPPLKIIKQFMGLFRTEHTADRFGWYERGQGLLDLMTFRKFRLEIDLSGRPDARVGERPGIYDDDADEATGAIVGEPEARHASNFRWAEPSMQGGVARQVRKSEAELFQASMA
jgi:hypothetical protein